MISPARRAALRVLMAVSEQGAYAQLSLKDALRPLSPEDRRLATTLVYGTLETRRWLDYAIDQKLKNKELPPLVRDSLRMGAYQLFFLRTPAYAAVNEAVLLVQKGGQARYKALVNAVLRGLMRDGDTLALPDRKANEAAYLSIRYNWPQWVVRSVQKQLGKEEAERFFAYKANPDEICLRQNPLKPRWELTQWLDTQDAAWRRGTLCPDMVYAQLGDAATRAEYSQGCYSVQGEAARFAAGTIQARPGMRILDACAAPGGKSCAMAEDAGDGAEIIAWDKHAHRVELIRASAARLGIKSIHAECADASIYRQEYSAAMDAVLLDMPCSGLGVTDGKPEIRLTATQEGAKALVDVQRAILQACCNYVRPGGVLVYSTCTVLKAENEEQIQWFLAHHPEFTPDPSFSSGIGRMLWPQREGTEGFFVARLMRIQSHH